MAWQIELTDEALKDIEAWPDTLKASFTRILERIEAVGMERLGEPFVKHLQGKLWEMRPSGKDVTGRALYVTATGKRVVIVLGFIKKTQKTPRRFIEAALERARSIE